MTPIQTAKQVLDRSFLEIRCRLIDIAAALDRVDRAQDAGTIKADPRRAQLQNAIGILHDLRPDRAERVQMVFSLTYDPSWQSG